MARWMPVCLLLLPLGANARASEELDRDRAAGGGVLGPAVLPAGSTSTMAWVGIPEVGGAWRQGLAGGESEVEVRLQLDYLLLAGSLEGFTRRQFGWAEGHLVPEVGGGVVLDSGARYVFDSNLPGAYLRLSPGLVYSRVVDAGSRYDPDYFVVTGKVGLPVDLGVSTPGAWRWLFTAGVGLEHGVGRNLWLMGGIDFGVGPSQRPHEELTATGFFHLRVGVGFRDD